VQSATFSSWTERVRWTWAIAMASGRAYGTPTDQCQSTCLNQYINWKARKHVNAFYSNLVTSTYWVLDSRSVEIVTLVQDLLAGVVGEKHPYVSKY